MARRQVVILGGGYVGLYTAWGLEKHSELDLDVTVVDPRPAMTYQPLLPEVAGGHVSPSNVQVDLQQHLRHTTVLQGSATALDTKLRTATVELATGETRVLDWDQVVVAMGAVTRTFPTPGLAEHGIGFKTIEEAVATRNRVLENVAEAAETTDAERRDRLLTFVFVGAGYTGVEALAELSDLSRRAIESYAALRGRTPRWLLVEALDRVAPEVGPRLSAWSLEQFRARGIDVRLKTTMRSCVDGVVELSTGERIPAGLIVWTAGVTPNPAIEGLGLPRGPKGHIVASARLQVVDARGHWLRGVWSAGDVAQVPDLTQAHQPAFYPPNAQNALRMGNLLAENVAKVLRGRRARRYRHINLGTVASYGLFHGAANIRGIELTGMLAWLAHRGYHLLAMPTLDRRVRILAGWIAEAIGTPDLTPTGDSGAAQREFAAAAEAQAAAAKD